MGRPITIDSGRRIAGAVYVCAIRTVARGVPSAPRRRGGAVKHWCQRAHLIHTALVWFYVSIAVLALSSLLGTIANRWFESIVWIPQVMTFVGVALILYAAIQLIRESKLLIKVILDDAEGESTT